MEKKNLISYWLDSSDRDCKTMDNLFKKRDYHWSLFMGHLVIEKLLKAYHVKNVDDHPSLIHNLLRFAEKSNLELDEEQKDFFSYCNEF